MRRAGATTAMTLAILAIAGATAIASGTTGASGTSGSTGATGTSGSTTPAPSHQKAPCPAGVAANLGPVQWLWSVLGKPKGDGTSASWTWTRGNGTWDGGSAHGTICGEDKGGGLPRRNVVLTVSGQSKLTPHDTKLGLLGVQLVLPVTVAKSDDSSACADGSTGTVTLFASYYNVHTDTATIHFGTACSAYDASFHGSLLHVEITRNGAQVNVATTRR
jgi:hypothetical protein